MANLDIESLLEQVNIIIKKYEETEMITGEKFNIFEILGLSTNETRAHSAFIGSLLNPKGHHGVGNKFLELFLKEIGFEKLDINSTYIEIEKNIGAIPKDYESGGRIDLVLFDKNKNAVFIENKIYAGDQHKQLYRYFQYSEREKKERKIIYLNLDGHEPSSNSLIGDNITLEKNTHFEIISYKENILNWLNECIDNTDDKRQLVKQALKHYKTLIENLTGKSNNKKMENEIKELLKSEDNFMSAKAIKDLYDKTRQDIYNNFWNEIRKQGSSSQKKTWNELNIVFQIGEDTDGFFFYFDLNDINGKRINIDIQNPLHNKLIKIIYHVDNKYKNNTPHLGWKYPTNSVRRFFELNDKTMYSLSIDVNRKGYVEELLKEGEEDWRKFESILMEFDETGV